MVSMLLILKRLVAKFLDSHGAGMYVSCGIVVLNLCRAFFGMLLTRLMVNSIGLEKIALVSQLQSQYNLISLIVTAPLLMPVIREVARNNPTEKFPIISKFQLNIKLCILITSISVVGWYVLSSQSFSPLFSSRLVEVGVVLFTMLFACANAFSTSILTGLGENLRLTIAGILSSMVVFVLSFILLYCFGFKGAQISVFIGPIFMGCISFVVLLSVGKVGFSSDGFFSHNSGFSQVLIAGSTTLLPSLVRNVSEVIIRSKLISSTVVGAGIWGLSFKISDIFQIYVSMVVNQYIFPEMCRRSAELLFDRDSLFRWFRFVVVIFVIPLLVVLIFPSVFTGILFGSTSPEIAMCLRIQTAGDILRTFGTVISFWLIACGFSKLQIFLEIAFHLIYLICSMILIPRFGSMAPNAAYVFAGGVHLCNAFLIALYVARDKNNCDRG